MSNEALIYNVYTLWEGMILAEEGHDNYEDAVESFDRMVEGHRADYRNDPERVAGTTVHLYDTALNVLVHETFVD